MCRSRHRSTCVAVEASHRVCRSRRHCVWYRNVWCRNVWCRSRNVWCRNVWCRNVWCRNVWCRKVWCRSVWCAVCAAPQSRVACLHVCVDTAVYVTRRVCYHSVCALVGGCQCVWSLCQAVGEEFAQRSPRRCTVFTSHCTLMALQVTCPCAAVHQSAELVVHITEHCSHHQLANAGEKNT